jgi:hypothetical protein
MVVPEPQLMTALAGAVAPDVPMVMVWIPLLALPALTLPLTTLPWPGSWRETTLA